MPSSHKHGPLGAWHSNQVGAFMCFLRMDATLMLDGRLQLVLLRVGNRQGLCVQFTRRHVFSARWPAAAGVIQRICQDNSWRASIVNGRVVIPCGGGVVVALPAIAGLNE